MTTWTVSQRVRFNLGGPVMLVDGEDGGKVVCQWFDGRTLHTGRFDAETLEEAPDDQTDRQLPAGSGRRGDGTGRRSG